MKFRLRTLLIAIGIISPMIALPAFLYTTVMPANRRVNQLITQAIGEQFEGSGLLTRSQVLDIQQQPDLIDLGVYQLETGDLYNRWDELVDVSSVILPDFGGKRVLSLTVTSTGPYGIGYNSTTTTFEYDLEQ